MIKQIHAHETGKRCFVVRQDRHSLTKRVLVTLHPGFTPVEFAAGYMPYTGHWYAFNIETGREIASFTREFFEGFIEPFSSPLTEDPDCVPDVDTRAMS